VKKQADDTCRRVIVATVVAGASVVAWTLVAFLMSPNRALRLRTSLEFALYLGVLFLRVPRYGTRACVLVARCPLDTLYLCRCSVAAVAFACPLVVVVVVLVVVVVVLVVAVVVLVVVVVVLVVVVVVLVVVVVVLVVVVVVVLRCVTLRGTNARCDTHRAPSGGAGGVRRLLREDGSVRTRDRGGVGRACRGTTEFGVAAAQPVHVDRALVSALHRRGKTVFVLIHRRPGSEPPCRPHVRNTGSWNSPPHLAHSCRCRRYLSLNSHMFVIVVGGGVVVIVALNNSHPFLDLALKCLRRTGGSVLAAAPAAH